MKGQEYAPFLSKIVNVKKHTEIEYTFSMEFFGKVKPGQFFQVSIPKYGEAPISVSGIGPDYVDLTIRRVGRVTGEVFERYEGDSLFMRGPYGNGFDVDDYKDSELVIIAGGTGVSPVRGVAEYFSHHPGERRSMTMIAGFKSPGDILFQADFKEWEKTMDLFLTVDGAEDGYEGRVGLVTKYIPLERGFLEENIWVSYERKMCCGIGKCGHCRIGDKYVCVDGPVFPYTVGKNLLD